MKSYDYEAVCYDGACYCVPCFNRMIDESIKKGHRHEHQRLTDESEEVSPVFADSEWDSYPVCDVCGGVHDYVSLTTEGQNRELLREAIEAHNRRDYDGFSSSKDQEYPDDDYEGEWLHVNERGNCTLYVRDLNGKDKEIASCV